MEKNIKKILKKKTFFLPISRATSRSTTQREKALSSYQITCLKKIIVIYAILLILH